MSKSSKTGILGPFYQKMSTLCSFRGSDITKNGFRASKNGGVVIFSRTVALNRKLLARIDQIKAKYD